MKFCLQCNSFFRKKSHNVVLETGAILEKGNSVLEQIAEVYQFFRKENIWKSY